MPFLLKNLVLTATLVALGGALVYGTLRRSMRRVLKAQSRELEERIRLLAAQFRILEARLEEQDEVAAMQASAAPEPALERASDPLPRTEAVAGEELAPANESELSPETMAILAAAVNAFLGKKARIVSARLLESPHEMVNAWSQQGRVFVQASHNLRVRS